MYLNTHIYVPYIDTCAKYINSFTLTVHTYIHTNMQAYIHSTYMHKYTHTYIIEYIQVLSQYFTYYTFCTVL